jgi:predicted GH43/DUF377 family glycosyl hydrolase
MVQGSPGAMGTSITLINTLMPTPPHFIPVVQRLNNRQPLLQKVDGHLWENRVTFNPACVLVDDKQTLDAVVPGLPFDNQTKEALLSHPALCFMLYRAQGQKTQLYDHTRSSIGLAVLSVELQLLARHTEPVILPDEEYDDLGVEDPRITRVGERFIMFYCAYGSGTRRNRIRIAIASSTDFIHWKKHGLLDGNFNNIDNKNAMLFQDRIDGKYVLLHRPMEGENASAIHTADSDDIPGVWISRGMLMRPIPNPEFVDTWIGGGAPPLKLSDGRYLILYHIGNRKRDGTREYNLGIAVADPSRPEVIVKRSEPLLRPATPAETTGDAELGVNNVVFVCGAYFYRGDLYFPYAGADSVILGGKISQRDIQRYLTS